MNHPVWPEDPRIPANMDDLLDPLEKALGEAHRRGEATYDGAEPGSETLATSPSIAWWFTREGQVYRREQGLTIRRLGLLLAFQLGVEQGRRLERRDRGQGQ